MSPLTVTLPAIVFTDLDGTLLDHHSYDWTPTRETLLRLEALKVPVIFNTSKTRAELLYWQKITGNRHPFIVENGSAIFIPQGYYQNNITQTTNDYDVIELGVKRSEILAWLDQQRLQFPNQFTHFAELDAQDLIRLTDLSAEPAELALQRDYSEAIRWRGDSESRNTFIQQARDYGYRVLVGGRFLHILGQSDKGKASQVLLETLQRHTELTFNTTIACGDSQNDVDMLEWADVAIIIRSPNKAPPTVMNTKQLISQNIGPMGWVESFGQMQFMC